ncbi:PA2779 family protein [Mitsuaria sp. TWR114]|uniref:PA2779 family protein n=1 Tax=Mitsuaria sp. TWR114 TaxID=2601731 RepID=UPI00164C9103|nr:PA2779 family protein [Mitsuaria sp. TWR114]
MNPQASRQDAVRPSLAKRAIASTLIVSCSLMALPMHASAQVVPTDALVQQDAPAGTAADSRVRVNAFFAREDVRQAMVKEGVNPADAQSRVDAMSDDEIRALDGRIAQAPAGGDVLGVIFAVFVILLVTDILGFTKVFPFTRSIR